METEGRRAEMQSDFVASLLLSEVDDDPDAGAQAKAGE